MTTGVLNFTAAVGLPTGSRSVTDEHTREALAMTVARTIDADATVPVLDGIVAQRGTRTQFLRMDNGPELTAHALADWCR